MAKRRYSVKTPNFIAWVVSCVGKVKPDLRSVLLDDYELRRIMFTKKWAERAPIEEVMVVLTKLGFPMTLQGMGESAQNNYPTTKIVRRFEEDGSIETIIDTAADKRYFCLTSREVMKMQVLYSQILNGAWFVPNQDYKSFVKVMKQTKGYLFEKNRTDFDYDNMKLVFKIFSNFLLSKQIMDLSEIDYVILFYMAHNDDLPTPTGRIVELFAHKHSKTMVGRSLKKLTSFGHLQRHAKGKLTQYIITHKGWKTIELCLKEFMRDVKFWDIEESKTKTINTDEIQSGKRSIAV